jgi:hypothetical protein
MGAALERRRPHGAVLPDELDMSRYPCRLPDLPLERQDVVKCQRLLACQANFDQTSRVEILEIYCSKGCMFNLAILESMEDYLIPNNF